jgi:flagellar basal-body rod modification protein FlgD
MQTSSILGASSTAPSSATNTKSLNLTSGDFMQLLVTQLQNQDPLNPVSSTDFASQLAQFSTLQGVTDLNTNFSSMLQLQQLTQGAALVGKNVTYAVPGVSSASSGVVTAIALQNGQLQLLVGGATVPLSQVQSVQEASPTSGASKN